MTVADYKILIVLFKTLLKTRRLVSSFCFNMYINSALGGFWGEVYIYPALAQGGQSDKNEVHKV